MTDEQKEKIDKLESEISKLQRGPKDGWDIFNIFASLLIPASITFAGVWVSKSLKEAEIESAREIASGQEEVARINAKVGQANLVYSFMESFFDSDIRERTIAIEAMLIALPEEGLRLVNIIKDVDPNEEVKTFARQKYVESILDKIEELPIGMSSKVLQNPPSKIDDFTLGVAQARLGGRTLEAAAPTLADEDAKALLKQVLVMLRDNSPENLNKWSDAIDSNEDSASLESPFASD